MSLKGLLKRIVVLGAQISFAFRNGRLPVKQFQTAIKLAERRVFPGILYRNRALRFIQRTFVSRNLARPFSTFHYRNVHYLYNRREFRLWKLNPSFSPLERIRNIFISNPRYNESIIEERFPESLDGYEIGDYIAHGCNAAVYGLRVDGGRPSDEEKFPLALKIMFNYDYSLPERYIWEGMGTELVPLKSLPKSALVGQMGGFKPFKRQHPNIIKMHTAFVDLMPHLREAAELFEEAAPSLDNFGLIHDPKTLFVVMKRYRTTLREYSLRMEIPKRSGQVLFGQLLEALVYLSDQGICHRDMKSDNILLDYDYDDEIPHLVLSDFGSALVSGFKQTYIDEFTDLGGNIALRAPEISRANLSPGKVLDYSKADLWSAGAIGYEMFGQQNPFYSRYSSRTYQEKELPTLPSITPNVISKLIGQLLKIHPSERPDVKLAANVVAFSLFSLWNDIKIGMKSLMKELLESDNKHEVVNKVLTLFAAETFTARSSYEFFSSELQLRATFFSRVAFQPIYQSLLYFDNKEGA
ncbi:unnamed protein product [Bursaphelenchus xylophilus]|uniref:non-specific serine/threonine protein kinase n=1 Tax=Bursaphelenchus xylophilus TaxID=6326 RepID=A0A1I7RQ13_BURXY|nr:unnamed protein product [Bursaphelenchus xylophilus]CAG9096969.1 unnamed protein product [Bursaphelenchus xylophilus]